MNQNLLYSRHEARQAKLLPKSERSPLLTYGDVPAEYAASQAGAVLFDETDRGLVQVRGSEAADFLQRLLANVVLPLEVGQGNRNLLLTSKGKIRFDFDLIREEQGFALSTIAGQAAGLAQALDMFLFAEDVKIRDASEEYAPLLVLGKAAESLIAKVFGAVPSANFETRFVEHDGHPLSITRLVPLGPTSFRIDGGPERASAIWEACLAAGALPAGRIVADIVRIEACRALPGEDIDENIYPQEARLEEAFNLSKGCYIGQEVVAKINTYGGLNKRLCQLRVSHSDPVQRGERLYRWSEEKNEWRDLGQVTSWAYSFEHDSGQVLAYVKRRHQDVGTTFRIGAGPAEATLLQ